jgi:translation initiation factor IF-2
VENERIARDISVKRLQAEKEKERRQIKHMSLDDLYSEIKQGTKELGVVVKGDADGSVEALSDSLQQITTDKLKVTIVHKSVGAIKESDVLLAATTNSIIIGFHVHPNSKVRELAEKEGVEIRLYKIIYEAIEEIQKAAEGMLEPVEKEFVLGSAEVREVFKISKTGVIAGCKVTKGVVKRTAQVRLVRDGLDVVETRVASLRRHKDDASEVAEGFECGIGLDNFNDIRAGDILDFFEVRKIKATL